MIDLKQKELYEWQSRNFPRERYLVLSKEQLVDIIYTLQVTLLKGIQGIREGINGIDKEQVADGIADTLVYGQQLASELKIDLETEIPKVIDSVLVRNWIDNKVDATSSVTCYCEQNQGRYIDDNTGFLCCNICDKPVLLTRSLTGLSPKDKN